MAPTSSSRIGQRRCCAVTACVTVSVTATVPVGYAEGYHRILSNRAAALIRGERRPLLGRVTMDACVFRVDGKVEVGDEVVLLGEQNGESIRAEELARWADTINYETTTGIDPRRVERSYREE